jgi:hypothetical protein
MLARTFIEPCVARASDPERTTDWLKKKRPAVKLSGLSEEHRKRLSIGEWRWL